MYERVADLLSTIGPSDAITRSRYVKCSTSFSQVTNNKRTGRTPAILSYMETVQTQMWWYPFNYVLCNNKCNPLIILCYAPSWKKPHSVIPLTFLPFNSNMLLLHTWLWGQPDATPSARSYDNTASAHVILPGYQSVQHERETGIPWGPIGGGVANHADNSQASKVVKGTRILFNWRQTRWVRERKKENNLCSWAQSSHSI